MEKDNTLKVCEIFTSIQGESSYAGWPCTFVRLTGCNLRCGYCDTKYAYYEGDVLTVSEIAAKVAATGIRLAEITGGEPLLQKETPALAETLCGMGIAVVIETNGSIDISCLKSIPLVTVIMDIKTPSSGMSDNNDFTNIARLTRQDEVKFVIGSRDDYTWAVRIMRQYEIDKICTVLMSPMTLPPSSIDPKLLSKWILDDKLSVRLNIQLHRYIFGQDVRGV
ncbi:MAG: radical SAM protein [Nitrospirae bacterium]|nr:radical SAM protein [Nitrospirota bacterium]